MNNLEKFMEAYERNLRLAIQGYPDEYAYPLSEADYVIQRMRVAIGKKSFNKDSRAIRATCKELKIKHTYRDIETFLGYTEGNV
jgi:hypothetical protein